MKFQYTQGRLKQVAVHGYQHFINLKEYTADPSDWKEGEIVEEGEFVLQHQMTTWKKEVWQDCGKEAYDNTVDDARRLIARRVKKEGKRRSIYIASKTKHAEKWLRLKGEGVNIVSTWIHEAGPGESKDMSDLCLRCVNESLLCDAMIVYAEEGDYLKGAFIEMGLALSVKLKPVYLVGPVLPVGSAFTYSHQVFGAKSVEEAIKLINDH